MKNRSLIFLAAVSLLVGLTYQSRALIPVAVDADLPATANEVVNYVQYIDQTLSSWERVAQGYTQIAHQLTQITNQITQIENQVIQMERFGSFFFFKQKTAYEIST